MIWRITRRIQFARCELFNISGARVDKSLDEKFVRIEYRSDNKNRFVWETKKKTFLSEINTLDSVKKHENDECRTVEFSVFQMNLAEHVRRIKFFFIVYITSY